MRRRTINPFALNRARVFTAIRAACSRQKPSRRELDWRAAAQRRALLARR